MCNECTSCPAGRTTAQYQSCRPNPALSLPRPSRTPSLQALVFQDWPALAHNATAGILDWERDVEQRQRPALEAGYAAALAAGGEAAGSALLVQFTHSVVRQAVSLLERLAQEAAESLGLPGVPPDAELVGMLDAAAERYAFRAGRSSGALAGLRKGRPAAGAQGSETATVL